MAHALKLSLEPSLLLPHTIQASAIGEQLGKYGKNTAVKAVVNNLKRESEHDQMEDLSHLTH